MGRVGSGEGEGGGGHVLPTSSITCYHIINGIQVLAFVLILNEKLQQLMSQKGFILIFFFCCC